MPSKDPKSKNKKATAKKQKRKSPFDRLPPEHDWRTSDEDELLKRKKRASQERMRFQALDECHPVFTNFSVRSDSGRVYTVEVRSYHPESFACTCPDYRQNGLGTCKHIEALKKYQKRKYGKLIREAASSGSPRIDIALDRDSDTLSVERNRNQLPPRFRKLFDSKSGVLNGDCPPKELIESLRQSKIGPKLRLSVEIDPWLNSKRTQLESKQLRHEYEMKVANGTYPPHETTMPLYPYQREGMLHLAFNQRALLADEMGLGKTIQAIAASALLHRLGKAKRALVIAPASLKAEWQEQIQKFTALSSGIVFGNPQQRVRSYSDESGPFFTIINYEQARVDTLNINHYLQPDIVILDEAQRIKNWTSLTARAVKRLESRFAFVLTGTPIENRIDDAYSIIDFLDPQVLGPLFRFNREFYTFDERGRPNGYKNLRTLHERIAPLMIRRRKAQVETELPDRTDHNLFVELSEEQKLAYSHHAEQVTKLQAIAKRQPLTREQHERLMRELGMIRMICDTCYILDPDQRTCPKLKELMATLEDCLSDPDVKVVVFSEWVRMLELVQESLTKAKIGYALHTGKISQQKRRTEIRAFKEDPACRVLLCSESGGAGLNLQVASVIINCDLPWNPAKFEQRVARAWRKHQKRPVTVVNLISANTIEHGMLSTLDAKRDLSEGVLDLASNLDAIPFKSGSQNFLKRLEQTLSQIPPARESKRTQLLPPTAERPHAFSEQCQKLLGDIFVSCEESFPTEGSGSSLIVTVERDAKNWIPRLEELRESLFGKGKWNPEEPVQLHVLDRSTAAALAQMEASGLLKSTTRMRRLIHSKDDTPAAKKSLSPEIQQRIQSLATTARHKLDAAKLLFDNGFVDMAFPAIAEVKLLAAQTTALSERLAEPTSLDDLKVPPLNRLLPSPLSECLDPSAPKAEISDFLQTAESCLNLLSAVES